MDRIEAKAIADLLGNSRKRCFGVAPKAVLGDTLGAHGSVATAIAALLLHEQRVPPSGGGVSFTRYGCLRFCRQTRSARIRTTLITGMAWGGAAVVVVLAAMS
jgi:3-oxoacyl-(acyl-carrier-protein) synthase